MQAYGIQHWILFFFAYCLVGWIWESGYVSIRKRRFVNRGFLYGPWIPLYGSGAMVMLFLALPLKDNLFLVYIVGMLGATLLELITGWAMETIFKVKYWDYSNQKIQYKGYICLSSSLFWGFLTIAMVQWIHNPFERIILGIPEWASITLAVVLSILFGIDIGFSMKEALDMRRVLVALEQIHREMEQAQKQFAERLDQSRQQFESQLEEKVKALRERKEIQLQMLRRANAKLLKRHPSASYRHMENVLADLKKRLEEWEIHSGRDKEAKEELEAQDKNTLTD